MNRDQMKYLKQRIDDIFLDKMKQVQRLRKPLPDVPSRQERLKMAYDGKSKKRPLEEISYHTDFVDAFICKEEEELERVKKENNNFENMNAQYFDAERNKVLDALILGDAATALERLKEFEDVQPMIASPVYTKTKRK